jgi:hypothetical protein
MPLADLEQAGVPDRDRRPSAQDDGGLLVPVAELAVRRLGQVQAAPDLPADQRP